MEGTSVLAQNKKKVPAEKTKEQSVLGGSVKEHKPITFYKKAWFWIIIAVVVLGTAGLIVFLVINANIAAEAIKKFDENVASASTAVDQFESSFSEIYSESGLSGYYTRSGATDRMKSLHNKCLEKYGANDDIIKTANELDDIRYMSGEQYSDKYGSGKTREVSENAEKAANIYKEAKKNISECEGILKDALNEDVEITFGEFKIIEGRWFNDTEMTVKIKNTSDTSHKFRFTVEAQDEKGNKIDDDYIYTKTLSAGEEAEEKAFEYVSSRDEEKMKTAKFVVKKLSED